MNNIRKQGRPKKIIEDNIIDHIQLSIYNDIINHYKADLIYEMTSDDCPLYKQIYIQQFFNLEPHLQNLLILYSEFDQDYTKLANNLVCLEYRNQIVSIIRRTKTLLKKQCTQLLISQQSK